MTVEMTDSMWVIQKAKKLVDKKAPRLANSAVQEWAAK